MAREDHNKPKTVQELMKWLTLFPEQTEVYATLDNRGNFRLNAQPAKAGYVYPFLLPMPKEAK